MQRLKMMLILAFVISQASCSLNIKDLKVVIHPNTSVSGYASASYGGRVYYYSDEDHQKGLFSMQYDGSDAINELELTELSKLAIVQNMVYFIGKVDDQRNAALYTFDIMTKQTREVSLPNQENIENFTDFHINSENNLLMVYDYRNPVFQYLNIYATDERNYELVDLNPIGIKLFAKQYELYNTSKSLFIDRGISQSDHYEYNVRYVPYVLDLETCDLSMSELYPKFWDDFNLITGDDHYLYSASVNKLSVYNLQKNYEEKGIRLKTKDESYFITNMKIENNGLYVLAQRWDDDHSIPNAQLSSQLQISNETVFYVNPVNDQQTEVFSTDTKQRILNYGEDYIIVLDNRDIRIYQLSDRKVGNPKLLYTAADDLLNGGYFVENARNWLFIYRAACTNVVNPHHLVCAINMDTGVVIEK